MNLFTKLLLFFMVIFLMFGIFYRVFRDSNEIVIGTILPLSGINSSFGNDVLVGASSWLNHINENGGVEGKKIKFVAYDDWAEPKLTIDGLNSMLKSEDIFTLFGVAGSENIESILPIITKENLPLVAPFSGASFLSQSPQIVNLISSYKDEVEAIVNYLHVELGFTKFGIFYQNDRLGEEAYNALVGELKKYNLELVGQGSYARNTLFIENAVYELEQASPEVIVLASSYKPALGLIKELESDVYYASLSSIDRVKLSKNIPKDMPLLSSQTLPPFETSLLGREFIDKLRHYYPKDEPSQLSYEAYLGAKILTHILELKPPSRKLFLGQFNSKKELFFWDVKLTLNKKAMHQNVYLVGANGQILYSDKKR